MITTTTTTTTIIIIMLTARSIADDHHFEAMASRNLLSWDGQAIADVGFRSSAQPHGVKRSMLQVGSHRHQHTPLQSCTVPTSVVQQLVALQVKVSKT